MKIAFHDLVPQCAPTAYIAPNTILLGDVHVDEQCTILFGAVLRAENFAIRLGPRCCVQDTAVIHPGDAEIVFAEDCTIGYGAKIHGGRFGRGSFVGANAVVLQGAEIGEECIIAAGAIVRLGMKIPSRSLVAGVPARIIRQLSDEDVRFPNQAATDFYLTVNEQFRGEGALKIIE